MVLTPRDHAILHAIYVYRLVTREQIEQLLFPVGEGQDHFTRTSKARERLRLLFHHGYVERIPMLVGSEAWAFRPVYRLASKGAAEVASDLSVPVKQLAYWGKGDDKDHRDTRVSSLFLEHALKLNDVRIAFMLAAHKAGVRIEEWLADASLQAQERKDYVALAASGESRKVAIVPDAYCALSIENRRYHFFLELDRATMSLPRWATRVEAYRAYVYSGKYTERYHSKSLRILTVTTTEERLQNLKTKTAKAQGGGMFWFAISEDVSPSTVFFSPIWLQANDERDSARKSLLG